MGVWLKLGDQILNSLDFKRKLEIKTINMQIFDVFDTYIKENIDKKGVSTNDPSTCHLYWLLGKIDGEVDALLELLERASK